MTAAESNTQNLTHLVQQMLKSNINMSRRLRNIERMHPAMDRSVSPSLRTSIHDLYLNRLSDSFQLSEPAFEKELETSPAYKRAAFNRLRVSQSSSNAASGPSFLSGLSLCDVSNVTAMALPISSTELWNHHRYTCPPDSSQTAALSTLDAWYNPQPKVGSQPLGSKVFAEDHDSEVHSYERLTSMGIIPTNMRNRNSLDT